MSYMQYRTSQLAR